MPDVVQIALVAQQAGVGVDHAFGSPGGSRGVDDAQRIAAVDIGLQGFEDVRRLAISIGIEDHPAQLRGMDAEYGLTTVEVDLQRLGEPLPVVIGPVGLAGQQNLHIAVGQLAAQLRAVAKVGKGTPTAPIRAAASMPTRKGTPLGYSSPT